MHLLCLFGLHDDQAVSVEVGHNIGWWGFECQREGCHRVYTREDMTTTDWRPPEPPTPLYVQLIRWACFAFGLGLVGFALLNLVSALIGFLP